MNTKGEKLRLSSWSVAWTLTSDPTLPWPWRAFPIIDTAYCRRGSLTCMELLRLQYSLKPGPLLHQQVQAPESAFLTSFKVTLFHLVRGTHFEDHDSSKP